MDEVVDAVQQVELAQPAQQLTRTGRHRPPRRFDRTQLRERQHGQTVHRDYCAHFFRWVTVKERIKPSDTVLDVGCGQDMPLVKILGHNLSHVPRRYVGVDLNPISVGSPSWAVVHGGFNFVEEWPRLKEFRSFDRIVCFEVIEHMGPSDGVRLLHGFKELLAPDGVIFLSTPVFSGKAAVNHCHEYTIPELTRLIQDAGLAVAHRYGTFGDVRKLEQVLTPEERVLWHRWAWRLGNDGLAVVFATDHPDESKNNIWFLRKQT